MIAKPNEEPDPQKIVELDRRAWNLPAPQPSPVGPIRDVWPVRDLPARSPEPGEPEDPAAA